MGRTIQLFLMDGTANGRKKATLRNWTGVTHLIPRTMLQEAKSRDDLKQTGVYFLVGTEDETPKVYIGQARERKNGKGVLGRILEHIGQDGLDYWTHAIAIVTSDDSFGATEISFLENSFFTLAKDAGRFRVTNANDPSPGTVTEEKEAELREFIANVKLVVAALGYKMFDPVDESKDHNVVNPVEQEPADEPTLYFSYAGTEARGRQASDGFIVLAGARLRPDDDITTSGERRGIRKLREKYRDHIGSDDVLTSDLLLGSPSTAACFVGGSSLNGLEALHNRGCRRGSRGSGASIAG
ncbi:GIY-YIG nuclease family protein [Auritidibacter ignavus]|uniref:GIY-YIG nuclease family protein n=1 Tax=Auritidibacter ignavus TaxID=678932 RepID=UPI00244BBAA5|nr:GIY-YIG nuclease family protein [Auritidibacter ignavus]WGH82207.1 GIY-YIG nuclease family protein [Auritidibacter ignavus]